MKWFGTVIALIALLALGDLARGAELGCGVGGATSYTYPITSTHRASMPAAWLTAEARSGDGTGTYVGIGAGRVWCRRRLIVSLGAPYQPEERLNMYPIGVIVGTTGKSRYHKATTMRAELWTGPCAVALGEWSLSDDEQVGGQEVRWRPMAMALVGIRREAGLLSIGVRGSLMWAGGLGNARVGGFVDGYFPNALQGMLGLEVGWEVSETR